MKTLWWYTFTFICVSFFMMSMAQAGSVHGFKKDGDKITAHYRDGTTTSFQGPIESGTYTPTTSNTVNLDSVISSGQAYYQRVGNVVTISVQWTSDATTANLDTSFESDLPIDSSLVGTQDASGVITCFEANNAQHPTGEVISVPFGSKGKVKFAWTTTTVSGGIRCKAIYTYLIK